MTVNEQEFVSLCSDVMDMVESFGDDILGPSEEASFDSFDEFDEALVQEEGESFVFGIDCGRKGLVYSVLGSPSYDYFEVTFVHTLMQSVITKTALTDEEQERLSDEERAKRIENASVNRAEIGQVLSNSRNAPLDVIDSKVYNELGSQTGCSFRVTKTETGDIVGIEALQKIFVQDDDFSRSDFEDAIVAVTNVGKSSIFLLAELYNIDSISPESLVEIRDNSRDDGSRYIN